MLLDPIHSNFPKGNPAEPFEKGAAGKFESALYNMAYIKDVANKRTLVMTILVVICVLACVLTVTTFSYKTYVVRVDNATGQVMAGGELKATNYTPQEAEIKHFFLQYIEDIRTVPLDPVQFKRNWTEAQAFMTPAAMQKLSALIEKNPPAAKLGKATIQPRIKSIQLQPDTRATYQIRWTDEEFSLGGGKVGKVDYVGLFTLDIVPPEKEEVLLVNPLGMYITDLNITRESNGGAN
ncbi:type IV secretion system protein [Veillonella magna]|uniref:Type IV secretion system protein n=1 Tax=Veillonella magna TaxID=464322 RepID=A0ABS2GF18_9FIRM|nr:type IV secretion system protein [Veillonella magna]MBM6911877.1 type IV secretion system protein [Veillonella magna]